MGSKFITYKAINLLKIYAKKLLIALLADASGHGNMARALHAFLYALQAKAKGMAVELIFDGAGTEWAAKLPKDERLKKIYQQLLDKGIINGVCAFCSVAFNVAEELKGLGSTFLDEDNGHPNIGALLIIGAVIYNKHLFRKPSIPQMQI